MDLGVDGVAIASTVAELCSGLIFLALLRRKGLLSRKPTLPAGGPSADAVDMGMVHGSVMVDGWLIVN